MDISASSAECGLIRQWMTAVDCGRAMRLVLAALGQAALVSGSSVIESGTRNLALHAAPGNRTVARVPECWSRRCSAAPGTGICTLWSLGLQACD